MKKAIFLAALFLSNFLCYADESEDVVHKNLILTGIQEHEIYTIVYFCDTNGMTYKAWIKYSFTNFLPQDLFLPNGNYVDRILNANYVGRLFDVQFAIDEFIFEYADPGNYTTIFSMKMVESPKNGLEMINTGIFTQDLTLTYCLLDANKSVMGATFYSDLGGTIGATSLPSELPMKFGPYEWNDDYLIALPEYLERKYRVKYDLSLVKNTDTGELEIMMAVLEMVLLE